MWQMRNVITPIKEVTLDEYVYFRAPAESLNVSRSDGKRLTFQRGWLKTNNEADIAYLDQLVAEGQIGIKREMSEEAEIDFANAITGSAADLAKIEKQIAADPRFAAALSNLLGTVKSSEDLLAVKAAADDEVAKRNTTSENAGRILGGMGNSQGVAAAPSVSSDAEINPPTKATLISPTAGK